jgi:hypothetical protein
MRSTNSVSRAGIAMMLASAFLVIFAVLGASSAFAACTEPFNCFAGDDGDQVSGPGDLADWQDIAGFVTPADDPTKGSDTKFSGGDKETEPGGWDFITGNNTPKTDILEGWSKFDGRFLYAARRSSPASQRGGQASLCSGGAAPPPPVGLPVSGSRPIRSRSACLIASRREWTPSFLRMFFT